MFKKSPKTKQFDMFSSPSGLLCEREGRLYDDPISLAQHVLQRLYQRMANQV